MSNSASGKDHIEGASSGISRPFSVFLVYQSFVAVFLFRNEMGDPTVRIQSSNDYIRGDERL